MSTHRRPPGCRCDPTVIARFRDGDLVSVTRRHHPECGLPTQLLDPDTWRTT